MGVTSRPLAHEAALLPADPKLELVSGLELSQDAATIVKFLKTIKDIEQITHVYFAGKFEIYNKQLHLLTSRQHTFTEAGVPKTPKPEGKKTSTSS